jgi:hypothetical protein
MNFKRFARTPRTRITAGWERPSIRAGVAYAGVQRLRGALFQQLLNPTARQPSEREPPCIGGFYLHLGRIEPIAPFIGFDAKPTTDFVFFALRPLRTRNRLKHRYKKPE